MPVALFNEFERLIRRDPAQRGLTGSDSQFGPLCEGHLEAAAAHLAEFASHVGLVTGFYVPHGDVPAAETDGPLGTALLAGALNATGIEVAILTDERCADAVICALSAFGTIEQSVLVYPHSSTQWLDDFYTSGPGRQLTHLISVERVGPSHTVESHRSQPGHSPTSRRRFAEMVPDACRDRCHNMRGDVIDGHTADMHRLFDELPAYRPQAKTIGIGDGGNEIGMGTVLWEQLERRLDGPQSGRVPCRIPTDWTIVAGTSDWGAYALAAAVVVQKNRVDVLREWDREHQRRVLHHMVENGPAIDGVTGRREPTVDGLPFLTYIQPWEGIRGLLEL